MLGCVSDVQYADVPDGRSWTGLRYWQSGKKKLTSVIEAMLDEKVDAVLHAGDLIDGKTRDQAKECLEALLETAKASATRDGHSVPVHYIIGNHELYHLPRPLVRSMLGLPMTPATPQTVQVGDSKLRVILLDSFAIGLHGFRERDGYEAHEEDLKGRVVAETLVRDAHAGSSKEVTQLNAHEHLPGLSKRFVAYNGGLSHAQIRRLEEEIGRYPESVFVVASHVPTHPAASNPDGLLWDYEPMLEALARHPRVVAMLCGHDHDGGYSVDVNSLHHITMPGIVEIADARGGHLLLRCTDDDAGRPRITLHPRGAMADLERFGMRDGVVLATPRLLLMEGLRGALSAGGRVNWRGCSLHTEDVEDFVRGSTFAGTLCTGAVAGKAAELETVGPREWRWAATIGTPRWRRPDVSGARPSDTEAASADAAATTAWSGTPAAQWRVAEAPGRDRSLAHVDAIAKASALTDLDLGENLLGRLPEPDGMWALLSPGLKVLRLDGNALTDLPAWVFTDLPELSELDLSGNPDLRVDADLVKALRERGCEVKLPEEG